MNFVATREKSSQSDDSFGALRDERGLHETCFVGLGEKNRKVCLMGRRQG